MDRVSVFSDILNWINTMMNVAKFDNIDVKCCFPRVKYPLASNPLNELIFSIICNLSSELIAEDNEMTSLSSRRFSVTSWDFKLMKYSIRINRNDPYNVASLMKGMFVPNESNKNDKAK